MKEYKCAKCGHMWWSRLERKPVVCPRCKSYDWEGKDKLFKKFKDKMRDQK